MIWYILILVLANALVFGIWYLASKYYYKDEYLWVLSENKMKVFKSMLVAMVLASLLVWNQLYAMGKCAGRGMITKMDTQYSWLMGECQARTVNGSYISIDRNRGIPDSNDNKDEHSQDNFVIE